MQLAGVAQLQPNFMKKHVLKPLEFLILKQQPEVRIFVFVFWWETGCLFKCWQLNKKKKNYDTVLVKRKGDRREGGKKGKEMLWVHLAREATNQSETSD